jgi:hypothetical protein
MAVVVAALLEIGCRKVPVAGLYCDGTPRWPCSDPQFPRCDVAHNLCIGGSDGGGAGGADLSVDLAGCASAADCPVDRPICAARVCRACTGSADDAACATRSSSTPRCFVASGRCSACAGAGAQSSDCPAASPVCGDGGRCRPCAAHDECDTKLCNFDGSCAATGTVAYADNGDGSCAGVHAATLTDRACDITAALMVNSVVRVFGSKVAYPRLTLSSGDVQIVGPDVAPTAQLSGDLMNPAVAISGANTRALLDRLEITGGGTGQDGIACFNGSLGPSLTLLRSFVHGVGGAAINSSKCTLVLDRDQLGPSNGGGGMVVAGGPFTVTNSFIVGNANGGAGVTFGASATGKGSGFMHNTVASNTGGGIVCTAATTIANTIVSGNTPMDTSGACTLSGSTTSAPNFMSVGDFHLAGRTAANLACCIDQIASSPVDHDVDGRARPQPANGKWDVGAHEVP